MGPIETILEERFTMKRSAKSFINRDKMYLLRKQNKCEKWVDCINYSETRSVKKSKMCDPTYINDPVHGLFEIHPLCKAVIDTREFQRLRYLKQCGISYLVFPGALHTRFEHSLGVSYLSLRVIKKLQELNANISEKESLCIQLAALCHDLGHGPFSHTWERFVERNNRDEPFKHEEMSANIFDYLIEKNNLVEDFMKYGIVEDYRTLIKDMILGIQSDYKTLDPEPYLFEIVANKDSGLDIDKYEYLLRDSFFFGTKIYTDFERFLSCIRIVKGVDDKYHIAYLEKLRMNILDVFKDRAVMHNIAYNHRVCLKLETMLIDVFSLADNEYQINVNGNKLILSKCHTEVEAMLNLTDHIFHNIMYSEGKSLEAARKLAKNMHMRQHHYKEVFVKVLEEDDEVNDDLLLDIEEELESKYDKLTFRCRKKQLVFGQYICKNGGNPLKQVLFIKRDGTLMNDEDSKWQDSSLWLPRSLVVVKLFVFCDQMPNEDISADVENTVNDLLKRNNMKKPE